MGKYIQDIHVCRKALELTPSVRVKYMYVMCRLLPMQRISVRRLATERNLSLSRTWVEIMENMGHTCMQKRFATNGLYPSKVREVPFTTDAADFSSTYDCETNGTSVYLKRGLKYWKIYIGHTCMQKRFGTNALYPSKVRDMPLTTDVADFSSTYILAKRTEPQFISNVGSNNGKYRTYMCIEKIWNLRLPSE